MAKLFKKVQKMIDDSSGKSLRNTLIEYNLANITKKEAMNKGLIFYETWLDYFTCQYEMALKEDIKRELMEIVLASQKRE